MTGLDTNILVRYLTQDDPLQAATATEIMERRLTEAEPGFISVAAMVEMVWVLESSHDLRGAEIATAVERILQVPVLLVECEQEVFTAMVAVREDRASFADALIGILGARAGCTATVTFDRRAARLPEFELL